MATRNDITGDALVSKKTGDSYRDGWDRIFSKSETTEKEEKDDHEIRNSEQGNG